MKATESCSINFYQIKKSDFLHQQISFSEQIAEMFNPLKNLTHCDNHKMYQYIQAHAKR